MLETDRTFEIIFVNDGSEDDSLDILKAIQEKYFFVKVISLFKNQGKSNALEVGFNNTSSEIIISLDIDNQFNSSDIPKFIRKIEEGYDVVYGRRKDRQDDKTVRITSKIFNMIVKLLCGLQFEDYFTGFKCYRKSVLNYLALYGNLYRFAAVIAYKKNFKVCEIPVEHKKRIIGKSNYNFIQRFRIAIGDLIMIFFMIIFNPDRVYYLRITSYFLLSFGLIIYFDQIIFHPNYAIIKILGLSIIFISIQGHIIANICSNFFKRHVDDFENRKRNIDKILYKIDD
jgi:glycosyltransferase involved in cell wall biosynthesis